MLQLVKTRTTSAFAVYTAWINLASHNMAANDSTTRQKALPGALLAGASQPAPAAASELEPRLRLPSILTEAS